MSRSLIERQVRRRASVGTPGLLNSLSEDLIDKIWKLVELPEIARAIAASRRGARKLRLAFFYKTRRNRRHPGTGVQDIDEWAYIDSTWWRNLMLPQI